MGAVYQRVYVFKKQGEETSLGAWNATQLDLSMKAFGTEVKKGTQNIKDTFTFILNRAQDFYKGKTVPDIEYGDLVRIWMKRDSSTFVDSDLLMEGIVVSAKMKIGPSGRILTIKGTDFFETLFNVQIPVSGVEGRRKTWNEILRALLNQFEFRSRNLFWAVAANGWTGGDNPTVKSDGSSFPQIDFALNYTPFYKIVETLSSDENTGDGQYTYRVGFEGGKRFLVLNHQKETSALATLTEGELATVNSTLIGMESIQVDKASLNTINYVVYNGGNDLYGDPIEYFVVDYDSAGKIGFKYYYMIEETSDTSKTIMQEEALADNGSTFNWSAGRWTSDDHFPTSFNYTWLTQTFEGSAPVSTNKADFNDDLREIVEEKVQTRAQNLIDNSKTPQYTEKLSFPFRNDLVLGGSYQISIPDRSINRKLRIKEISYTIKDTIVDFEEDVDKAEL